MEQKKFYQIIDQYAEHWYIDANAPIKGVWASSRHPKGTPHRKTNSKGEEYEPNLTTGEVQVLKWQPREQMCLQCCKMTENKREEINLKNGQVKCSCGLKYPVIDVMLKRIEA